MKGEILRIRAYVSGKVQGVFYRASAREKARELSLKGWVKNLPDGRVEWVAEGTKENIGEFLSWCRKGPPQAMVEEIKEVWETPTGKFADFLIEY